MTKPEEILEFWKTIGPQGWWVKNPDIDNQIAERFTEIHTQAATGKLSDWQKQADSALALVIVLDQFSRNLFRNDPRSFAQDALALEVAKTAINQGLDQSCDREIYTFFYLPHMHSECISDQEECVILMHKSQKEDNLRAAITHLDIIKRFGRFPHRNQVLGRHTTPTEKAFLEGGGFSG